MAWATPSVTHLLAEICAGFIIDSGSVSVIDLGSGSQGAGLAIADALLGPASEYPVL